MFRIRSYGDSFHPDHFQGRLGFCIRVLNWFRWRLETIVQRLVIRYLANQASLPADKRAAFRHVFDLDVQAERLEKEQTSPRFQRMEMPPQPTVTRAERYIDGAQKTAIEIAHQEESDLPVRPKRITNMIATYGAQGRERRYGRRYFTAEPNGDFEPIDGEDEAEKVN